ncbi:MAG: Fur family transcriptional regulator [Prevotellaceae bacterium]|nr:Fur family transcriptional regulator [Prevotellaceae bacterium]
MQTREASILLTSHGIKPTQQRIAIMSYILEHRVHPTIEDVYNGLITNYPTLSRTTVYNTLRMFSEHSAAQMITIDEHRVCYDGDTHPHPHFICRKCGQVFDLMHLPLPNIPSKEEANGFKIDEMQLYYKGLCPDCCTTTVEE